MIRDVVVIDKSLYREKGERSISLCIVEFHGVQGTMLTFPNASARPGPSSLAPSKIIPTTLIAHHLGYRVSCNKVELTEVGFFPLLSFLPQ